MRLKLGLVLLASTLAGCAYTPRDLPDAGLAAVNTPVVSRADYEIDVAAPGGMLDPAEASRLDAWFRTLDVRYGDQIYVDAPHSPAVEADVARLAGQYGLAVSPGAPVTTGPVPAGTARVILSRTVVAVPGCPNWARPSHPNYNNQMLPNFGCAVNANLAAQVANPQDLIHGRAGDVTADSLAANKAIQMYRDWPLTGIKPGQDLRPLPQAEGATGGEE